MAGALKATTSHHILVADDESAITAELVPLLQRSGFRVTTAGNGNDALRLASSVHPDLIVLDVLMPGMSGREVCRQLRAAENWTPVLMLTQIGAPVERAMSLEEGADDYLNKPFDPFELIARIKAILRRSHRHVPSPSSARRLVSGDLVLDRTSRRVLIRGRETGLTMRSVALLEYFMLHPDEVLRRDRLLDEVWGWDYPAATRAVDMRIAELRRALVDDADHPRYIETIVGEGYRFLPMVEAHI